MKPDYRPLWEFSHGLSSHKPPAPEPQRELTPKKRFWRFALLIFLTAFLLYYLHPPYIYWPGEGRTLQTRVNTLTGRVEVWNWDTHSWK